MPWMAFTSLLYILKGIYIVADWKSFCHKHSKDINLKGWPQKRRLAMPENSTNGNEKYAGYYGDYVIMSHVIPLENRSRPMSLNTSKQPSGCSEFNMYNDCCHCGKSRSFHETTRSLQYSSCNYCTMESSSDIQ